MAAATVKHLRKVLVFIWFLVFCLVIVDVRMFTLLDSFPSPRFQTDSNAGRLQVNLAGQRAHPGTAPD
jgi:hypothetical protein